MAYMTLNINEWMNEINETKYQWINEGGNPCQPEPTTKWQ